MVININSKIAIIGDNRAADSVLLEEIRNCFSSACRSDVEFYNFAKKGNTANIMAEEIEDALAVNPDMIFIMVGYSDINMVGEENEKLRGFASAIIKVLDICKEKGITPILATCPALAESGMESLAEYAEKSTKYFDVIRNLSTQNKVGLVEANEEFYLGELEALTEGKSLISDGEITTEGNQILGKIIAEELLSSNFRI